MATTTHRHCLVHPFSRFPVTSNLAAHMGGGSSMARFGLCHTKILYKKLVYYVYI